MIKRKSDEVCRLSYFVRLKCNEISFWSINHQITFISEIDFFFHFTRNPPRSSFLTHHFNTVIPFHSILFSMSWKASSSWRRKIEKKFIIHYPSLCLFCVGVERHFCYVLSHKQPPFWRFGHGERERRENLISSTRVILWMGQREGKWKSFWNENNSICHVCEISSIFT